MTQKTPEFSPLSDLAITNSIFCLLRETHRTMNTYHFITKHETIVMITKLDLPGVWIHLDWKSSHTHATILAFYKDFLLFSTDFDYRKEGLDTTDSYGVLEYVYSEVPNWGNERYPNKDFVRDLIRFLIQPSSKNLSKIPTPLDQIIREKQFSRYESWTEGKLVLIGQTVHTI